jgi:hypothetical protein
MTARLKVWALPAILYVAFFAWYTDLGGPLTPEETEAYLERMTSEHWSPAMVDLVRQFASEDTGRQFLMLNAVDYNENPPDVEGAEPGEDATRLMGRYMEHMLPALLSRASHPVFMGLAVSQAMDIVGIEGAENWDFGAMMRYRSRRTMLDIVTNPKFAGNHDFKLAALDKTIAYPIEPRLYLGDLRLILGLILLSVTALVDSWLLSRRLSQQNTTSKD